MIKKVINKIYDYVCIGIIFILLFIGEIIGLDYEDTYDDSDSYY